MNSRVSLFPVAAAGLTAFALIAGLFVSPDFAKAQDREEAGRTGCSCPGTADKPLKPKFADLKAPLDENDEIAALESVQFALSEVADGSTYVWHRSHGRLSGLIKPTSSFKDTNGNVCRHILVVLNGTETTRKTETVACRLATGVWKMDG